MKYKATADMQFLLSAEHIRKESNCIGVYCNDCPVYHSTEVCGSNEKIVKTAKQYIADNTIQELYVDLSNLTISSTGNVVNLKVGETLTLPEQSISLNELSQYIQDFLAMCNEELLADYKLSVPVDQAGSIVFKNFKNYLKQVKGVEL